jgi:transcriptional regulator with XRE-family HTH domain
MNYGRAIRIVRSAFGLSQAQLADLLTIGPSQLSFIESGKRKPSLKVLGEVSTALEVPPHLLTLLASEPEDVKDPRHATEVSEMANSLLRVLVSGGPQPRLPITSKKKKAS